MLGFVETRMDGQLGFGCSGCGLRNKMNEAHKNSARIQRGDSGRASQLCGLTFELTGPLRYVAKGPE